MKPHDLTHGLFPKTIDELFQRVWGEPRAVDAWTPSIDVRETDDAFVIRAEIPGIDVGDVEVTLTGDTLTIHGEKKAAEATEDAREHIVERVYGSFSRTFTFPVPVSTEDVDATATQGVLTVTVKKADTEQKRKIEIKSE